MLGDQHLDEGLARDTDSRGFAVEALDHPDGEVDIDASLLTARAIGLRPIEIRCDVLAAVKLLIEILRFKPEFVGSLYPELGCRFDRNRAYRLGFVQRGSASQGRGDRHGREAVAGGCAVSRGADCRGRRRAGVGTW